MHSRSHPLAVLPQLLLVLGFLVAAVGVVGAVGAAPAAAHEERPASFPDGTGKRPAFLGLDNPQRRVVCTPRSGRLIAQIKDPRLKRRNRQLLKERRFGSIQTAVNSIRRPETSVYVLPGRYTERRWANLERSTYCSNVETASDDPLLKFDNIGSVPDPTGVLGGGEGSDPVAMSYADQMRCPHNLNLIAILGDQTPDNDSIRCDNRFCGTQIVGTGPRTTSVVIDNRFSKLNAIRADRVGGLYLSNFTVQQGRGRDGSRDA